MKCDKCGREVEPNNDVGSFMAILADEPLVVLLGPPRHLLPVEENGQVVCEGSPSSAQYLEGQPRDTRPQFPYRAIREAPFREAFRKLQEEAASRGEI